MYKGTAGNKLLLTSTLPYFNLTANQLSTNLLRLLQCLDAFIPAVLKLSAQFLMSSNICKPLVNQSLKSLIDQYPSRFLADTVFCKLTSLAN